MILLSVRRVDTRRCVFRMWNCMTIAHPILPWLERKQSWGGSDYAPTIWSAVEPLATVSESSSHRILTRSHHCSSSVSLLWGLGRLVASDMLVSPDSLAYAAQTHRAPFMRAWWGIKACAEFLPHKRMIPHEGRWRMEQDFPLLNLSASGAMVRPARGHCGTEDRI